MLSGSKFDEEWDVFGELGGGVGEGSLRVAQTTKGAA